MMQQKWQQPASYRGVPFFVDTTEDELARRGAHYQFPQRDKGVWEDLGKDDTLYTVSAYVTELSPGGYAAARDKLITACTTKGMGDLVHPYYGTKKVQCQSCRVSHDKAENGVARLSLIFIEADEPAAPAPAPDSAASINGAADAAQDASVEAFATDWSLAGLPGYVADAAGELVQDVSAALTILAGPLPGILDSTQKFLGGTASLLGVARQALADPKVFFMRQANALTGGLFGSALGFGRQIAGLGRMLSALSGTEKKAYSVQQSFMATGTGQLAFTKAVQQDHGAPASRLPDIISQTISPTGKHWPAVPLTTSNRKAQASNQQALKNLVERTAVIEAARMSPYMAFESREEALAVRDTLTAQLDFVAERASDTVYKTLETLRAAVVADITRRGPELGRIGSYTPKATRPALVLAYEVHQDATRASELAARNHTRHPGFMPGGIPLEVKIDE